MLKRKINIEEAERFNPFYMSGLNDNQIKQRQNEGLVNSTDKSVGKTYWEIFRTNLFSSFNILLIVIAAFMIYANVADGNPDTKWHQGLFFLLILIANSFIGLYQDIKAKNLMKKMKLLTAPKARVIRNDQEEEIDPSEIVLDDVLLIKSGEQITSDGVVLHGSIFVDESLLTGESHHILKQEGDVVYSGTFVISGTAFTRVDKVGADNYIETLSKKAKTLKKNPSHILLALNRLFGGLSILISVMAAAVLITNLAQGSFTSQEAFISIISPLSGQLVAMIPSGLYLLTSLTLTTGVISLYRKNANVQDLYSIEMLARADVLCVDKTGTITDGTMKVKEVVSFGKVNNEEINQIVSNICLATGDDNATSRALNDYFKNFVKYDVVVSLPFNSENKYSGASFASGMTYLIGAIEYMDLDNKDSIIKKSEEYTSKGLRVLALVKGNNLIKNNRYEGKLIPLAFVILEDHIKEDAKETFKWFAENNVEIKVISGDNALTVSEIAKEAGIANAESYISLEGMSLEEVCDIADKYTVFGRVTPEQKETIVLALKQKGKTVAMTGDGVNDILALKRADCSIAMNSGSQAAKNVAHVVLLTNNFATMPEIVAEGRRVINNLERTGSLFLTKTIFAIAMAAIFWVVSLATVNTYSYPFSTRNMSIWEFFTIGVGAFFVALEPNSKPIRKGFLRNVFAKAIPCSIAILIGVGLCYLAWGLQATGVMYTGVDSFGYLTETSQGMRTGATSLAVLTFSILSFVVFLLVCRPLNKYRTIVTISLSAVTLISYILTAIESPEHNILQIDISKINMENYLMVLVIVAAIGAVMLVVQTILHNLERSKIENENK